MVKSISQTCRTGYVIQRNGVVICLHVGCTNIVNTINSSFAANVGYNIVDDFVGGCWRSITDYINAISSSSRTEYTIKQIFNLVFLYQHARTISTDIYTVGSSNGRPYRSLYGVAGNSTVGRAISIDTV